MQELLLTLVERELSKSFLVRGSKSLKQLACPTLPHFISVVFLTCSVVSNV